HNHDPVVHQHPQAHDQAKEDHGVHGISQAVQDHQCHEHGKRNGKAHEKGVLESQEKHQHGYHQDDTKDDVVHQIVNHPNGRGGLVVGNAHLQVLGKHVFHGILHYGPDFLSGIHHVLAGTFLYIQHDHRFPELPGIGGPVFILEADLGNVPEVDGFSVLGLDHEVLQVPGLLDFPDHPDGPALPAGHQVARRDRNVAVVDGRDDVVKTHLGRHHLINVHGNLNFLLLGPADIHLFDFQEPLN